MRRPPLVEWTAAATGSPPDDDLGALLHVIAAGRGTRRAASISDDPVLVAWIAAALAPGTPLFVSGGAPSIELFADDVDLHFVGGDWRAALEPEAPFDLVHVGREPTADVDGVVALATPRATLIVPLAAPEPGAGALWLDDGRLDATVVTSGSAAAVVAVVRG